MDVTTLTIAFYGAIVSTAVAVWNIWRDLIKNRPHLTIDLSYCKYARSLGDSEKVDTVILFRIVNVGHVPVFVDGVGCSMKITKKYKDRHNLADLKENKSEWMLRTSALYDSNGTSEIFPKELKAREPIEGQINYFGFLEDDDEHTLLNVWVQDSTGRHFNAKRRNLARIRMWHEKNPTLSGDLSVRDIRWR